MKFVNYYRNYIIARFGNTGLLKAMRKDATSPPFVANPLISAAHNHLTVFVRWRQCARACTIHWAYPITHIPNGSAIVSAVFARSMPHSPDSRRSGNCSPHRVTVMLSLLLHRYVFPMCCFSCLSFKLHVIASKFD